MLHTIKSPSMHGILACFVDPRIICNYMRLCLVDDVKQRTLIMPFAPPISSAQSAPGFEI